MNPARLLILGANGQLGSALRKQYPEAIFTSRDELDVSDPSALQAFDWSAVDAIVNAAAFTNVDGAETTEGRVAAWKINATATAQLAIIANLYNLTLVHISTDYVFDGTKAPHTESEDMSPLSVYGQSKAAGDLAASVAVKHYIIRTSWVIGEGKNFVRTMLNLAEKNISPSVVSDQIGRLTFTETLATSIDHLLANDVPYGIYNVSNGGEPASWADITRAIFQAIGRDDLTVTNTTTEAYFEGKPGIAPRPLDSTFDLSKAKQAGIDLPNWRDILQDYVANQTSKEQL